MTDTHAAGAPGPADAAATARAPRTLAIDALRGAVMVLMVLDHARSMYFGRAVEPTDMAVTTVALFLTRWVTHYCAPVFVFLAGVSAYLYGARHGSTSVSRYLLTRGAWLVLLEVTVVRLGFVPDPTYRFTLLQVIWAIGWCFIVLAALSRLPPVAVLVIGAVIVAGHNLLDRFDAPEAPVDWLWSILHQPSLLEPLPGRRVYVGYPLLPWIGVICLGWSLGPWFARAVEERRRWLLRVGLAGIALFVVLRAIGVYGDPDPWSVQSRGAAFTVLSFLNTHKYPPSLLYLAMTLGPALVALAWLDRARLPAWLHPLLVFGRVPLFFYVAHLYLLRISSGILAFAHFGPSAFEPPPGHAGSPAYPLWGAYLAWIVVVVALYWPCRWFARLKERRADWWLGYL